MEKIFIVEDDEMVRDGIVDALGLRNWETETASSFQEAVEKIKENTYMLYILDMKLPDGNGMTLCRQIRRLTEAPILFLSAYDSEGYIVEGFEAGGDDYVIKPFRTFELLARIQALLKRAKSLGEKKVKMGVRSGDFFLDLSRQCLYKKGIPVELTLTEYRILRVLITKAPQLLERAALLDIIWDSNENYVEDNALSVYINRIRGKLTDHSNEAPIETKRGVGYRWTLGTEDIYETIS
ncbi:response regulator transcription factor [Roseburia hominis]